MAPAVTISNLCCVAREQVVRDCKLREWAEGTVSPGPGGNANGKRRREEESDGDEGKDDEGSVADEDVEDVVAQQRDDVRNALKQLVREWSAEGAVEREQAWPRRARCWAIPFCALTFCRPWGFPIQKRAG